MPALLSVLCLQHITVLHEAAGVLSAISLHVAVKLLNLPNGDAPAFNRLGAGMTPKRVGVHGEYHVPNVVQSKVVLVASVSYPLPYSTGNVWKMKSSTPIVVHRLFHFLQEVTAFIQDNIVILVRLHLRIHDLLVARPSTYLGATVVLYAQGLPSRVSVPRSVFWPLAFELLDDAYSAAWCCWEQDTPNVLGRRSPCALISGIKRRGIAYPQSRERLGLALTFVKYGLHIKRKADSNLAIVLAKGTQVAQRVRCKEGGGEPL